VSVSLYFVLLCILCYFVFCDSTPQVALDPSVDQQSKRHEYATKQLTAPQLVKLLALYSEWLGGDEAALAGLRVARLAKKSITSYTSNVRRFFVYLHVRSLLYSTI
jgi:hypothetical protein